MGESLQDQLVKAGLASAKQARKGKPSKPHKKPKKRDRQAGALSNSARAAQDALVRKAEQDRALNRQREQRAQRKATVAQIRQLIEQHRLTPENGETGYNYLDRDKVRKVYVTPDIRERLGNGHLAITRLSGRSEIIPLEIARKISERDPGWCVIIPESGETPAGDDPYAAYKVPDDLMW